MIGAAKKKNLSLLSLPFVRLLLLLVVTLFLPQTRVWGFEAPPQPAYPTEIQLKFREALERLHLVNPDDPIFELMLVLGLWATYYQKISRAAN